MTFKHHIQVESGNGGNGEGGNGGGGEGGNAGGHGNDDDDASDDADDPSKKKPLDPENSTDAGGPLTNQQSDVQGPNDTLNQALLADIESIIIEEDETLKS